MSKKIMLINADHPEECRAVILEDGKIEDLIVEHASHEQIKGNIYLGIINRVEPSIEAAFVDYGGKKYGFLPFKDVRRESYIQTGERKARVRIQDVLIRNQKILVQVAKEGRDLKGPSMTNSLSLPGRFLVLMAGQEASAISRKIEDEAERKKLKEIIREFDLPENMGLIIRTAGLGRTKLELQKDLQMLLKIWETIENSRQDTDQEGPLLIYKEPDLVVRTVRDHFTTDTTEIIVDTPQAFKALKEFTETVMPRMRNRIKLYQETKPLFSQHNVEEQIESFYHRKVYLPAGGSIVIDIGEAMVSIDVNSGKTTSASELEETAVKTNLEAAEEIARQLRLRDLGGLVVIDFIDMYQKKNKSQVERQLKQACKKDKARINISRISKFGLLEMSRQRISPPVKAGVFEECARCNGTGHVKSVDSTTLYVLRKIQERLAGGGVKVLSVEVTPEVSDYLLNNKMEFLQALQDRHGVRFQFVSKQFLPSDDFAFNVLEKKKEEETAPEVRTREPKPQAKTREGPAKEPQAEEKKAEGEGVRGPRRAKGPQKRRYTKRKTSSRRTPASRGRKRRVSSGEAGKSDTPASEKSETSTDMEKSRENSASKENGDAKPISAPMESAPDPQDIEVPVAGPASILDKGADQNSALIEK